MKIDLFALYLDGKFNENSFANLSTSDSFDAYFKSVHNDMQHLTDTVPDFCYEECKAASVRLTEVLVGVRDRWWLDYAVMVDDHGMTLLDQTLHGRGITFGKRLKEI